MSTPPLVALAPTVPVPVPSLDKGGGRRYHTVTLNCSHYGTRKGRPDSVSCVERSQEHCSNDVEPRGTPSNVRWAGQSPLTVVQSRVGLHFLPTDQKSFDDLPSPIGCDLLGIYTRLDSTWLHAHDKEAGPDVNFEQRTKRHNAIPSAFASRFSVDLTDTVGYGDATEYRPTGVQSRQVWPFLRTAWSTFGSMYAYRLAYIQSISFYTS
jgi:hypothetical protein